MAISQIVHVVSMTLPQAASVYNIPNRSVRGLQCDMTLVIASMGSEGLLGTEALQSCLPHQLDLRTGPVVGHVVNVNVTIWSPAGIPPGHCSLIEPDKTIAENYDVVVSRTLVDTSNWSAEVLLINPGSDVVVLLRSLI